MSRHSDWLRNILQRILNDCVAIYSTRSDVFIGVSADELAKALQREDRVSRPELAGVVSSLACKRIDAINFARSLTADERSNSV